MRTYVVQQGDSPASIAARFAGCPKCARDLVPVNPQKRARTLPNGYRTFRDLRAGETLRLPDKWFSKEFDALPPSYFKALPHPDGTTLGVGSPGSLGDYATLDEASGLVAAMAAMDDRPFSEAVDGTAGLIDSSVREAVGADNQIAAQAAENVLTSTNWAKGRNVELVAAIASGDKTASFQIKVAIVGAFSAALLNARLALQAFYTMGGSATPVASTPATTTKAPEAEAYMAPVQTGFSTGTAVGIGLALVGVAGGLLYLTIRKRR